jgi:hypothetical protein
MVQPKKSGPASTSSSVKTYDAGLVRPTSMLSLAVLSQEADGYMNTVCSVVDEFQKKCMVSPTSAVKFGYGRFGAGMNQGLMNMSSDDTLAQFAASRSKPPTIFMASFGTFLDSTAELLKIDIDREIVQGSPPPPVNK